jgi:predicted Zn-dependent protease
VASGGEGRYEAIEAGEIERLKEQSGSVFEAESAAVGLANRRCTETLEAQGPAPRFMADEVAATLVDACGASRNRQYFDLAAQALGLARRVDESVAMSEAAIARDPAAINSRLILVTTLHIAGRYADELRHLRFLMKAIPADPSVARYAIQAGKWGGDEDLARSALALLRQHNPAQAEAAGRFLEADLPPPRRPAPQ